MANTPKGRVKYIDIARFLGILGMMVFHVGNYQRIPGEFVHIKEWMSVFDIPLFFAISGFASSARPIKGMDGLKKTVVDKARRLLVPYIVWNIIYCKGLYDFKFFKGLIYGENYSLLENGCNPVMWYVTAFFLSSMIFAGLATLNAHFFEGKKYIPWIVEFFVCCVIGWFWSSFMSPFAYPYDKWPWGIDIAFTGAAFMIFGFLVKTPVKWIYSKFTESKIKIGIPIFIGSMAVFVLGYVVGTMNARDAEGTLTISMARGVYGNNYAVFVFFAALSFVAIMTFSMLLEKLTPLAWLGENSFTIMADHFFIYNTLRDIYMKHVIIRITIPNIYVAPPFFIIITLLLNVPIIFFVKKYLPVLNGEYKE